MITSRVPAFRIPSRRPDTCVAEAVRAPADVERRRDPSAAPPAGGPTAADGGAAEADVDRPGAVRRTAHTHPALTPRRAALLHHPRHDPALAPRYRPPSLGRQIQTEEARATTDPPPHRPPGVAHDRRQRALGLVGGSPANWPGSVAGQLAVLIGHSLGVPDDRGEFADPVPGLGCGPFGPGPRRRPGVLGAGRRYRAGGCLSQIPQASARMTCCSSSARRARGGHGSADPARGSALAWTRVGVSRRLPPGSVHPLSMAPGKAVRHQEPAEARRHQRAARPACYESRCADSGGALLRCGSGRFHCPDPAARSASRSSKRTC
jgi:hypothetical protein